MSDSIEALKGRTLTKIEVSDDNETITFTCDDGTRFCMYHFQDCCERVYIESVFGEWDNMIGSPILVAEVSTTNIRFTYDGPNEHDDCCTWTYYKLATVKGWVDIRWFGSSNGYYSEEVSFEELK